MFAGTGGTSVKAGKKCVYGHIVDGRLVYIGSGYAHRAFSIWHRKKIWRSVVTGDFEVFIFGWFSPDEAAREEVRLIKELKPECNLVHNGWRHTEQSRKKMSLAKIGNPGYWLGRRMSPEHREKLRLTAHRRGNQYWSGKERSEVTKLRISLTKRKKRLAAAASRLVAVQPKEATHVS